MSLKNKAEISNYFKEQALKFPEFQEWWQSFEDFHTKRLWHQLTVKIYDFVRLPTTRKTGYLSLYENFIVDFETKMNPLTLIEIVAIIIKDMTDYEKCLAFVGKMKEKVKTQQEASLLCSILMGQLKLSKQDLPGVKAILEEIAPIIDEETGVTPIHGRYFQLSSDYHQLMGNHCEYYRNALRYLGCSKYQDEPVEELQKRAFALALAALLGETIYNFGELLQHPIINHLKNDKAWLVDLLYAFNSGDLPNYEKLRPKWITQPDLAAYERSLRQKISLLCLMEMTFKSSNGVLTFDEIAKKTNLPENEVELLVMKALSLGLVKGTIDQVERSVHLTWVQPRVLDKQQISSLRSKLDDWCRDVSKMEILLEKNAQDIIG